MRRADRRLLGSALALACALWACGESDGPPAPAPAEAPVPGDGTAGEPEPAPPAAPDASAGAKSYAIFCASCHGTTGDAKTQFAQALEPPPTAHSNGEYMNALTDAYLFRIIKEGGVAVGKAPTMAAWRSALSDAEIRNVVAFIRTLADPPFEPPTP